MQDFYKLCEEEFMTYDKQRKYLYTEETLQEVCLGIHSMCVGSESKYFNGHTNITDSNFLVFGVKGLMDTNRRLKDCMLFNILSFMSNELLGKGNTAASVDELYLFLSNMTTIEYLRNCMKRVRKKDSSVILASQNIEDFLIPSIREFTKPLFSIPTHQFLFNAGQINPKEYMDALRKYQPIDEPYFYSQLRHFVLFRTLQVLGAYGFRGYFEKKPHFIQSVPFAIQNLRDLLKEAYPEYPYLCHVLKLSLIHI